MSDEKLIKLVQTTFSIYGLTVTKKLSAIVAKHLRNNPDLKPEPWLTTVVEQILTQNLSTPQVDIENIKLAIKESVRPASTLKETETVLNVIDAFTVPKVVYDLGKKKYSLKKVDHELFPDAMYKSLVFKERLDLLWYRTLKHSTFAQSKFGHVEEEKKLELVPIEFLLSEAKTRNVCIMGLLAQLTEGQYYLEDYGGSVKIDLKNTEYSSSLIMEGSIVLAQGRYIDGVFEVENICFPPAESSDLSRVNFGEVNSFGGFHPTSLKLSEKLKNHEETNTEFILFISEFWVDSDIVLNKFRVLLSGYSDSPPIAIVLCGHFLSSPSNAASVKKLKEGFKKLGAMLTEFPLIQQITHFIFVPGPYDLSAPKILPRPPLPKYLVDDFVKVVPNTHLGTNPCRIQYCTKEIVVFRENMLSKLCRNTLHYPKIELDENGTTKGERVHEAFAKSIVKQSHLAPLLFSVIPVYWKHDQALQLYPLPDLVVVADDFETYSTTYNDCRVMNPGSFVKSNFSFYCYTPSENVLEDCAIMDEEEI